MTLARATNDQLAVSQLLQLRGHIAWSQGDPQRAVSALKDSLAIQRVLDDRRGIARSLRNLGELAVERGDVQHAADLFAEGLTISDRSATRGISRGCSFRPAAWHWRRAI
jgi:hypothetical protein